MKKHQAENSTKNAIGGNVQSKSLLYLVPGKLKVKRVLAELFLSVNWCSKFRRADLPKFVLNEGLAIEQLLLRQCLCSLDFCTRWRIRLEAVFIATFLCVKIWNRYCLLLYIVGKFNSALPIVTENILGADKIILIALFWTFSIVSVTFRVVSR